jgi:hypothetical protein
MKYSNSLEFYETCINVSHFFLIISLVFSSFNGKLMTNLTNPFVSATIYTFITDLDQSTRRNGVSLQHKQPSLEPAEVFTGVATACRHNKHNPLLHGLS